LASIAKAASPDSSVHCHLRRIDLVTSVWPQIMPFLLNVGEACCVSALWQLYLDLRSTVKALQLASQDQSR
jgi:hypothetical protein